MLFRVARTAAASRTASGSISGHAHIVNSRTTKFYYSAWYSDGSKPGKVESKDAETTHEVPVQQVQPTLVVQSSLDLDVTHLLDEDVSVQKKKATHQPDPFKSKTPEEIEAQVKQFCETAASIFNIQSPEQWYTMKHSVLLQLEHGEVLLKKFTLQQILEKAYPGHKWLPWKFLPTPRGFWRQKENVKMFLDWLKEEQGLPAGMEGWYSINPEILASYPALGRSQSENVARVVMTTYPEFKWQPWRFRRPPLETWELAENAAGFFKQLEPVLNINAMEDWYSIEPDEVISRGGQALVSKKFRGSLAEALAFAFPKLHWQMWRFSTCPLSFWKSKANQRAFMEWFLNQLAAKTGEPANVELFYKATAADVRRVGGAGVLYAYGLSWVDTVKNLYPNHKWVLHKFIEFHSKPATIEKTEKTKVVDSVDSLLDALGGDETPASPSGESVLETEKKDHDFTVSTGASLLRKFTDDAGKALGVHTLNDWYNVSLNEIEKYAGSAVSRFRHIVIRAGSLTTVLQRAYPEHRFDPAAFAFVLAKTKVFEKLRGLLVALFPDHILKENYRWKHPDVAPRGMSFDLAVPSLHLVFEIQSARRPGLKTKEELLDLGARGGLAVIVIPPHWDMQPESLIQAIREVRPDLLQNTQSPSAPATPTSTPSSTSQTTESISA